MITRKWLYIKQHVYVGSETNPNKRYLYNTLNKNGIGTMDESIIKIIDAMHKEENLGCILIDESLLEANTKTFLNEAKKMDIFGLEDFKHDWNKPIQLMPVLSIQKDITKLRINNNLIIGECILGYLTELNIYVIDECKQECSFCQSAFRQFKCCTSNNSKKILDINVLKSIAEQIEYAPVNRINIIGGNIMCYPYINDISKIFKDSKKNHFWVYYKNIVLNIIDKNIHLIIDFPFDSFYCSIIVNAVSQNNNCVVHFLITKENDIENAERLIKKCNIINYYLHPLFDGHNELFFKRNVYVDEDDVKNSKIGQREIFCNQALNSNNFGSLIILPTGDVYANINSQKIGNLFSNSILELIYKELDLNTAWRKIRNTIPCNNCIYQYLCPPPSNYEFVIGKNNLCTVKF